MTEVSFCAVFALLVYLHGGYALILRVWNALISETALVLGRLSGTWERVRCSRPRGGLFLDDFKMIYVIQ